MEKLKKIVFIGGNRFFEDGPLLYFIEVCNLRSLESVLITDDEHLNYPCKNGQLFKDELLSKGIQYISVKTLEDTRSVELIMTADLIFSVNCHWIISKNILQFVSGKIFNYHNSSLPEQQGAACHSWRIMQGHNKFHLTFHHLTENIDEGETIYEEELISPINCQTLRDIYDFVSPYEVAAFEACLDMVVQSYPCLESVSKIGRRKFYWPRLNTEVNGFIDWAWSAKEIKLFCDAFDNPFGGASTFLNGVRIRLKNVNVVDEDVVFHPFQFGLIYRIDHKHIWIAAKNGGLHVADLVYSDEIKIRKGLRFITDNESLFNAKRLP